MRVAILFGDGGNERLDQCGERYHVTWYRGNALHDPVLPGHGKSFRPRKVDLFSEEEGRKYFVTICEVWERWVAVSTREPPRSGQPTQDREDVLQDVRYWRRR